MVKIFMRRGCSTGVSRRDVLDSGCHVADRLKPSGGREEQNVVLALVVAFFVIQDHRTVKKRVWLAKGSRRQLNDLPDEIAAKITIYYYLDARDALMKALAI